VRKVLYLAFYFPPLGGGGVQRSLKFAKYLPESGFEALVVTGQASARTRHAPMDLSLAAEAPADLEVFRVAESLPSDIRAQRFRRLLGRPSRFADAWMRSCAETGRRVAAEHGADVILASMSPFETSEAAGRLSAELGVPWVADLRDPWALDEMIVYPTRWHRAWERRRMRRLLSSASLVIMNTPEAARALCQAFPELARRTTAITNGFDAEDFAGPPPQRVDPRLRIVHTGSLHLSLGAAHRRSQRWRRWAGGERVAVDILTRSHAVLLQACERWRASHPEEMAQCEIVLAGDLSDADRAAIDRSGVADCVRALGYVSHTESVALLRGADLLFLPMHKLPPGERARIVPGKTYEYLAARRPILAAVPEGDARDFVRESGLGRVCEPDDVEGMLAILRRSLADKREGRKPEPAPEAFYARFERRQLARQLGQALDAALSASHPARGR
jgi:glycosyltransferase involved in cell wall biosynthesis